ncbi:hypothetical protein ACQP1G_10915 [Nocardia sp. CA-107356]|uniref:hypothetical protein n=1 Tax=Nocardia sp. CA-107356 TaxID=3239972 RepID=UPI003D92CF24
MSQVVQQLVTLVGVVLGASGTFAATTMTERAKWRRSQDTRWDDRRLNAYMDYANALKGYVQVSFRMAATQGYPIASEPIDMDVGVQALTEANADRSVRWEAVLLLGSPAAVEAGRSWHQAAWGFSWAVRKRQIDDTVFVERYEDMGRKRDHFYACARADLGVISGTLPSGDRAWLPPAETAPPTQ